MSEITKIFGIVTVPAIIAVCYLAGATLKAIGNETLDKFIPTICGTIGGILGVVVFNTIPNYLPAENWLIALGVGIVSGLTAVGINQIYKQFSKEDETFYQEESPDEEKITDEDMQDEGI